MLIQISVMLWPQWLALRAAKDASAKGANATSLVRWATGMLVLGVLSLVLGYYQLWEISTDEAWQQANVDAPGIVLAMELLGYPLMAIFITVPAAAFTWTMAKTRATRTAL